MSEVYEALRINRNIKLTTMDAVFSEWQDIGSSVGQQPHPVVTDKSGTSADRRSNFRSCFSGPGFSY